jgi:hypothetical protein
MQQALLCGCPDHPHAQWRETDQRHYLRPRADQPVYTSSPLDECFHDSFDFPRLDFNTPGSTVVMVPQPQSTRGIQSGIQPQPVLSVRAFLPIQKHEGKWNVQDL